MTQFKNLILHENISIIDAMKVIDKEGKQFVSIVNQEGRLVGTVTDGDIRRGILKGENLTASVKCIMNTNPVYSYEDTPTNYKKIMEERNLRQLPILNVKNEVVNIIFDNAFDNILKKPNKVVLMVGGLGTRLRPLTEHIPKPMLKVGNKPILETIIEGFKNYGFIDFVLCVNYKKEIIQSYFQDGKAFGVNIEYIEEEKRMGTAGALTLLKQDLTAPFFVMNGDLLTQVNFEKLLDFHLETKSVGTMCVREYEYQIPFGVIETDGPKLVSIQEKPYKKEYVNAGIYMLSPEVLAHIPEDTFYDMPDLFNKLTIAHRNTTVFPIHEYWMDIGRVSDFEQANKDYESVNVYE